MKKEVSICWFRRDLRLNDNTALYHALKSGFPVIPVFIFDTEILNKLQNKEDKRVDFIHRTLKELNADIKKQGASFYVLNEKPLEAIKSLCDEFDVRAVFTNRDYEPYAMERDTNIEQFLSKKGIEFHTYKDQVIFEKSEVMKPNGDPYQVYTPYSKTWKNRFTSDNSKNHPSEKHLKNLYQKKSFPFLSLKDIGFKETDVKVPQIQIDEKTIKNYKKHRNFPAMNATSHVDVPLRFGTVSVRELVKMAKKTNETFLNELIWREFFMMILYHFPKVVNHNFKEKYDRIQWRNNEEEFLLWCRGETGYPIVDAGMREMNETGYMHNRVRMITASFLCKDLLIDWRWGEAYFAERLLDYELSSNNGNWQWAAGTGCDAAPYFRIFNPTSQAKKFDPELKYINTWITNPQYNFIPPVVEHKFARARALEVYKKGLVG